MVHNKKHFSVNSLVVILILSVLLTGFIVSNLQAQLRKDEVNFEVLATVTMKRGDVLWKLAQEYYKDSSQWEYIKRLNKIPNERRIPVGTVIYIPVKDAEVIAKKADEQILEKKAVVDETALKIAELQKEIERLKKELENCAAKNEELAALLKEKDDTIAELTAQLEDMRATAKSNVGSREEMEIALKEMKAAIAEKEARIPELEYKLKQTQEEVYNLERANRELKEKIARSEKIETTEVSRETLIKRAKPSEIRQNLPAVAAMALAILGAMIWVTQR